MRIFLFLLILFMAACEESAQEPAPPPAEEIVEEREPEMVLKAVDFADLPGWGGDDLKTFLPAFSRSCDRIRKQSPDKAFGPLEAAGTYASWQAVCMDFAARADKSAESLKAFIEARFTPYAVSADDDPAGLFTGYYEASLRGSREKSERFNIPLYSRPADLVMVDLGLFREALKGQRIAGRVSGGSLVPYETRAEIVAGNWPHNDKVLVWVDDAVDAFFVQIQGSGVVQMEDGSTMRIGYAGQNGHPYYAIGRELIARGIDEGKRLDAEHKGMALRSSGSSR